MNAKESGIVKWFNNTKGYGFIQRESGSDVFVHYTAIRSRGYRTLQDGEILVYERREGEKGPYAGVAYRTRTVAFSDI